MSWRRWVCVLGKKRCAEKGISIISPSSQRLSRYQQFKDFQRRILVATNLFGRGMDIERVNIAFNYDMPEDSDTYLHRVSCPPYPTSSVCVCLCTCVHASMHTLHFPLVCLPLEACDLFLVSFQVARAGRFGTKGLAITFVSDENDAKILNDVQDRFEVNISELPDEIDISSYSEYTLSMLPLFVFLLVFFF